MVYCREVINELREFLGKLSHLKVGNLEKDVNMGNLLEEKF